jgi:hypothetical protein
MWKLEMHGARGTPFTDLGSFASINHAAKAVLKTENDQSEAIFFRVYADPTGVLFPTGQDVLTESHSVRI